MGQRACTVGKIILSTVYGELNKSVYDSDHMKNSTLLKTGIIGTVLAALCCFTPLLTVLLGLLGLSAVTGYLDSVLIPALLVFIAITIYALWKRSKT